MLAEVGRPNGEEEEDDEGAGKEDVAGAIAV